MITTQMSQAQPQEQKTTKSTLKDYYVHITGQETPVKINKSTPKAAASMGVRQYIKSIPLRQNVDVWVRSRNRLHRFGVSRDYDTPKHRRFSIKRAEPSTSYKKPTGAVPDGLSSRDIFKPAVQPADQAVPVSASDVLG